MNYEFRLQFSVLNISRVMFVFALFNCTPRLVFAQNTTQSDDSVYVEVKSAKLRERPLHWAPSVQDLNYGDKLEVDNRNGGWFSASTSGGKSGYVHESAVTKKVVVLKTSGENLDSQINQSGVVLAGKGFSSEVEANYAGSRKNLDFSRVDQLEKVRVSSEELAEFVAEGELREPKL